MFLPEHDTESAWMTLAEVANYLRLSRTKLYELAQTGLISCSKIARRWRFFRAEVGEWMLCQRPSAAERCLGKLDG
jgi:excisionase family DNA binding protein